jgi:hypothetical protein
MRTPTISRVVAIAVAVAASTLAATAAEPVKRSMVVHQVKELGLEIRTEEDPRWDTRLENDGRGTYTFVAETPGSNYPPAGMSFTASRLRFTAAEFGEAARGAVYQAALNYGLAAEASRAIALRPVVYGDLDGFEADFSAVADGTPVDVRVFFGHRPGKPAVSMQVYTLRDKLPHLAEQIRRSWTNVRYLERQTRAP